ncbi:hypothetical protein Barb6XT_00727 [Bacteroidales bacterium Barb6XT]|nr:hypothetical protein Barb6XT_00727 [Bacteroidales bacterium Barb6XT]
MKKFKIFVEGDADVKFLHDYVEHLFNITEGEPKRSGGIKTDIIKATGGWTKLTSEKEGEVYRQQMKKNTDEGGVNLIIFDADKNFEQRQEEILTWKTKYKLDFHLFLFPNNQDTGDLECLLEKIINPQNTPIFDCWAGFENCLKTKTSCVKTPLTIPAKKSKIYAYMETLHGETDVEKEKVKDPNRDFKDTRCWDLKAEALNPLRDFLRQHLTD